MTKPRKQFEVNASILKTQEDALQGPRQRLLPRQTVVAQAQVYAEPKVVPTGITCKGLCWLKQITRNVLHNFRIQC